MSTVTIEIPESVAHAVAVARRARDEGIAQAEDADHSGWNKALIDQAIDAYADAGRPFSANDLRHLQLDVPPALIGARFMAASVAGVIKKVGADVSSSGPTHHKEIGRWIRADLAQEATP